MTDPPRSANLPPGYDEDDPYGDDNLSTYPGWWRRNIEEFRTHELRPYRPPRFADGTYTPDLIGDLEAELGVEIRIVGVNPDVGDDWEIRVDGETAATVGRRREGEGYTRYEMTAEEFETHVRDAVDPDA